MKIRYAFICLVVLVFLITGCGVVRTSPFGETSLIFIPTSQEVALGRQLAKEIEKREKLCKDPIINEYVASIGEKIAAVCGRHDITYKYRVIESDELNAFALPGGWIYVYTGLLKALKNEAQLAFVLAHETGHVVGRHAIRRLQLIYGINFLLSLTLGGKNLGPAEKEVIKVLYSLVVNGYTRKEELEADAMGAYYTGKAGWNPVASVETIKILDSLMKFKPSGVTELFMDHPTNQKRIANLNRWISNFPKEWLKNPFYEDRYKDNVLRRLKIENSKHRKRDNSSRSKSFEKFSRAS
ncbi:M48 family metallopeptidase [Desulfurobacterium thermolithotrophum]|uniref:M48 family metallopeptidase n=1 Tax=Desulfurobacterium thermolithotrophum TaxID=64160 RepID=UPI0013D6AF98|nr:M48 family metallopeptidase [Desulfurobacterium thermolithotrophum]